MPAYTTHTDGIDTSTILYRVTRIKEMCLDTRQASGITTHLIVSHLQCKLISIMLLTYTTQQWSSDITTL